MNVGKVQDELKLNKSKHVGVENTQTHVPLPDLQVAQFDTDCDGRSSQRDSLSRISSG